MEYIWFLAGIIVGSIISGIRYWAKRASGTLRIDHTNPQKDIYRFDVADIESLSTKKEIVLKIDNNANLSQK